MQFQRPLLSHMIELVTKIRVSGLNLKEFEWYMRHETFEQVTWEMYEMEEENVPDKICGFFMGIAVMPSFHETPNAPLVTLGHIYSEYAEEIMREQVPEYDWQSERAEAARKK